MRQRIAELADISYRPMFGYDCYSVKGKFFAGFGKKNRNQVITRLGQDLQKEALKNNGIRPFSHGTKAGWVELDARTIDADSIYQWIEKGYRYAQSLKKS